MYWSMLSITNKVTFYDIKCLRSEKAGRSGMKTQQSAIFFAALQVYVKLTSGSADRI